MHFICFASILTHWACILSQNNSPQPRCNSKHNELLRTATQRISLSQGMGTYL